MNARPSDPLVSVIMPAYNAAAFVGTAVNSILGQTLEDFEFLVVEDGSTDATGEILQAFRDPRLKILTNERNLGLVISLNRGLAAVRGRYVARMDADDWSYPDRLALQVAYLEQHPEIGILSCAYQITDAILNIVGEHYLPETDVAIRRDLYCKYESFCHPAVMLRHAALPESAPYRREWFPAEDRDLWLRMLETCLGANLPQVLHKKREHAHSISNQNARVQSDLVLQTTIEALDRRFVPALLSEEVSHIAWARGALFAAFGLAMQEQIDRIAAYLAEAIQLNCAVARQSFEELLLDRIAIYMHNYDADVVGALALSRRVFAALPSDWTDLRWLQPKVEGQIHAIAAFHFASKGEKQRACDEARRALLRSRYCLRNRGLLKLALGLPVS